MKLPLIKSLFAAAAVLTVGAWAHADFTNTFDSGPLSAEWSQSAAWSAGPAGWADGGAMQCTSTIGGYTIAGGTTNGPKVDFGGSDKTDIKNIIATGKGHVNFDFIITGASFGPGSQFWKFGLGGNSGGGLDAIKYLASGNQAAGESDLRHTNIDLTFAQLGWTNAASSFYQLYFGSDSPTGDPVDFWIDNLAVYTAGAATATNQIAITNFSYSAVTGFAISGTGSPEGAGWRCLASTNVSASPAAWSLAGSGSISGGAFTVIDSSATGSTAKFYRMVSP